MSPLPHPVSIGCSTSDSAVFTSGRPSPPSPPSPMGLRMPGAQTLCRQKVFHRSVRPVISMHCTLNHWDSDGQAAQGNADGGMDDQKADQSRLGFSMFQDPALGWCLGAIHFHGFAGSVRRRPSLRALLSHCAGSSCHDIEPLL